MSQVRKFCVPILSILLLAGCARGATQAVQVSPSASLVIQSNFEDTWRATKSALREGGYVIYTRDKRGFFVAYLEEAGHRLAPHRTRYTVRLEQLTASSTRVTIDGVHQRYGVTLKTYPAWRNIESEEPMELGSILEQIQQHVIPS